MSGKKAMSRGVFDDTPAHKSKNNDAVKCHVLAPYKVKLNDFHATTVVKQNRLCTKLADNCDCEYLHASIVPIDHILEIAVERGQNTPYTKVVSPKRRWSPLQLIGMCFICRQTRQTVIFR